ncbi:centrosomal protein of 104 kDa-like isoform X2 [Anneissia japonica]|uniref:centrosomal protein of 104 kDa-like isoform X2 n=1 Tax=Anneissia japonica TaxID=1529436 RepID=UPI0014255400|nr:centrosomal protein of 104 kDa-like isoform X2 [Anneissia japonica]
MPHKLAFHVLHTSSIETGFSLKELEVHSPLVKGWQSSRFCTYPQEIILRLPNKVQVVKLQILAHQFLIPTKIEFYVGDIPTHRLESLHGARYKRLGYVTMSDNEKTGFKARELKSVHVNAIGQYLKIVIHKNFVNKYNLYNQVGIVAVNVIGEELGEDGRPKNSDAQLMGGKEDGDGVDPLVLGAFTRPDYISPLDDLAFDMYQDQEVAQIIRKLDIRKNEAVIQEKYDIAKRLKQAIADLQKVGERLGRFEVEKRRAIETEDYDLAKIKKAAMEDYRLEIYKQLAVHDLLEFSKPGSQTLDPIPIGQASDTEKGDLSRKPPVAKVMASTSQPKNNLNEERPLRGVKKQPQHDVNQENHQDEDQPSGNDRLSDKNAREAAPAIDAFGLDLVTKLYSKTWSYREEALLMVKSKLEDVEEGTDKEELRPLLRAATFVVSKGLRDKVFGIFNTATGVLHYILDVWVVRHKLGKVDTATVVDKSLPELLNRTADTNARLKNFSQDFILEMAGYKEVRILHNVPQHCLVPFKTSIQARSAVTRVDIVQRLLALLGIEKNSGMSVDNVMTFALRALEHTAGEVREAAIKLITDLYQMKGAEIKELLPSEDDPTIIKNPLYAKLFDALDKIDGKPTRSERKAEAKKEREEQARKKQAEIDALQQQLADLRAVAKAQGSKKQPEKHPPTDDEEDDDQPNDNHLTKRTKAASVADGSEFGDPDKQCVFCLERNEDFDKEGLDLHYWKYCPMLKRCQHCKQVVEVSVLVDHLLTECDSRTEFAKCPRCKEAHKKDEIDKHVTEKLCTLAKSNMARCPLCHKNIAQGEESWRNHLMKKGNCIANHRNVAPKQENGKAGNRKPAPKQNKTKAGKKAPQAKARTPRGK